MKGFVKLTFVAFTAAALVAVSAQAQDNAGNYTTATWTNGSNAGTGFGPWTMTDNGNPSQSGHFIGDSTLNGSGASGGINTSGSSWGLYANSGALSDATRPFSSALSIGQSVVIDMDNGFIDSGTVGLGLQTSSGANRIEFFFVGGGNSYTLQTASGLNTGIGFTADGLRLTFTLTGVDTMDVTVASLNGSNGGTNSVFTGISLGGTAGTSISQIRLFNFNAGPGGSHDAYYNNLSIIPEPSTLVLVGTGLIGAFVLRRRKA